MRVNDRPRQLENALWLKRHCNIRAAAAYLRKLNWSIEAALWILLGKECT